MELHPLFDSAGIDKRLLHAVETGRPVIALRRFKRAGVVYEEGDQVTLGDHKNDDALCRPSLITGKPFVATKEYYEASKIMHAQKEYKRDHLSMAAANLARWQSEVSKAHAYVVGEEERLALAKQDLARAKRELKKAETQMQKLQDNAPVFA